MMLVIVSQFISVHRSSRLRLETVKKIENKVSALVMKEETLSKEESSGSRRRGGKEETVSGRGKGGIEIGNRSVKRKTSSSSKSSGVSASNVSKKQQSKKPQKHQQQLKRLKHPRVRGDEDSQVSDNEHSDQGDEGGDSERDSNEWISDSACERREATVDYVLSWAFIACMQVNE